MQQRIADMGLIPLDPPPLDETDRYIKAEIVKLRRLCSTAIGQVRHAVRHGSLGQQRDQLAHVRLLAPASRPIAGA